MSVSKWRYTEECNGRPCPGDCDCCSFEPGDLISRDDAIEAVQDHFNDNGFKGYNDGQKMMSRIMALPSADAPKGDLISRQWLLEVYGDYIGDNGEPKYHVPLEVVRQNIKDAPSAEAVQGEWVDIDYYYRMATCSHCHKVTMFEKWGEYTKPYDFCPNCGARMKGAEHETD